MAITESENKKNMMAFLQERVEFAMLQGGLTLEECQIAVGDAERRVYSLRGNPNPAEPSRVKRSFTTSELPIVISSDLTQRKLTIICMICRTVESPSWWKCCPKHATERDIDVVCQTCANNCLQSSKEIVNGTDGAPT